MITRLTLDYTNMARFLTPEMWEGAEASVRNAHQKLITRNGAGNDFLGWLDLPETMRDSCDRIESSAEQIASSSDVLVVIGIGGSYLGARAVIDALTPPFAKTRCQVVYAGHHLDGEYLIRLLESLEGKRVAINIVSKSGTTTEPAIAFRLLKNWMEKRYTKNETRTRIIATTDAARGTLKRLADDEGYQCFVIPDDVGGRFSVLTSVGLFPIAAAGFSIRRLLEGAASMRSRTNDASFLSNPAYMYALLRYAMWASGKKIEVLSSFSPSFQYVGEWWKQLYGESEGKNGAGIFPASTIFTTDLHSLGQYIQDGVRNVFESFLLVGTQRIDATIPHLDADDGLEYLAGRDIREVNFQAYKGTALAHYQGGVPNLSITIPRLDEHSIGELVYFFEVGVALSGYALGVNPFDQPGVEAYKKNMFALLGKPGFETEKELITQQLNHSAPHIVE